MKPNDESLTQNASGTTLRQRYDEWYKLQSRMRLTLFYGGYVALTVVFCAAAWMILHPPHKLTLNDFIALALYGLSYWVLWPLITLRWKSPTKLA